MTENPSRTKHIRIIIITAVAVVLAAALAVGITYAVQKEKEKAAVLAEQQAADAALLSSETASAKSLREEARGLAAARTTSLVKENKKAAKAAEAGAAGGRSINTGDSTALPPAGTVNNAYGRPLVATQKGGNFKASAYNGATGAGNLPGYQASNSDVKAWIRIPGTNINHPVLQSSRGDHYYCHLNWQGGASHNGCLWTPMATSFGTGDTLSSNTVIYGHNWRNCRWNTAPNTYYPGMAMLESLLSYHYTSWAEQYPYIYYSTPSEQMTFVIFACFYTEATDWYIQPSADAGYLASEAKSRSRHNFNVDVSSGDKILTLSTCTRFYGNTNNQRFVVMARLMRPGEVIGPVSVSYNPNHRQPNVWG